MPKIISKDAFIVAGVTGDGSRTHECWEKYLKRCEKAPPENKLSEDGYEIRVYSVSECLCHVGVMVSKPGSDGDFACMELPASDYALFDVYVANGYDSKNAVMDGWLAENEEGYRQRLLDGKPYIVEYYGERFHGNEAGSVVEMQIPVEKS